MASSEPLPLNGVFDIYGVLERPTISSFDLPLDDPEISLMDVIPSIHCIEAVPFVPIGKQIVDPTEILIIRETILQHFSSFLLGDRLAAEYLYLSLFSKVYVLSLKH
jgi:hypothetical protein